MPLEGALTCVQGAMPLEPEARMWGYRRGWLLLKPAGAWPGATTSVHSASHTPHPGTAVRLAGPPSLTAASWASCH